MSRLFLSHQTADNPAALAVAQWLGAQGIEDCFLDISADRGLVAGERWQEALRQASQRCEAVIVLLSPSWAGAKWCLAEYLLAKQLGKRIIPVRVAEVRTSDLPPELTSDSQVCNLVRGDPREIFLVERDPIVPRMEVSFARAGLESLWRGLQRAGISPTTFPWPPSDDLNRPPYRGLKALHFDDAAIFFGRDASILRGLDALRNLHKRRVEKFFVILGASGAGKSSFLRAGLWPRLARDDRSFFPLSTIRPGGAAITGREGLIAGVESTLARLESPRARGEIREILTSREGLTAILSEIHARARRRQLDDDVSPTILFGIDQAEELLAADGKEESEALINHLAHLLHDAGGPPVAIVTTIRRDAFNAFRSHPSLREFTPSLFDLPPIWPSQYKDIVEGPARRATDAGRPLSVSASLTERLIQDTAGADAMPLLAFTMERLFLEYGVSGKLTDEHYDRMGGVRGSIDAGVRAAFQGQPIDEALLRKAFIPWLVRVDPETRVRGRRVAAWSDIPLESRPLLEPLIEHRLLVRDRRELDAGGDAEDVVEIAHEALIRHWPTLVSWLDADAENLRRLEATARAASDWDSIGRKPDYLTLSGERLAAIEALSRVEGFRSLLDDVGLAFIGACRAAEQAAQRRNRLVKQLRRIATAAVLALAVGVAVGGVWLVRQSRDVSLQTSRVLAAAAAEASNRSEYDRAVRFAMLASTSSFSRREAPSARAELAYASHQRVPWRPLVGHSGPVAYMEFSRDGSLVLTASGDDTVRVWNPKKGIEVRVIPVKNLHAASIAPDGTRILTAAGKSVQVWQLSDGKLLQALPEHDEVVYRVGFSPDGTLMLTRARGGVLRVWDANTGQRLYTLVCKPDAIPIESFSPDSEQIATAGRGEPTMLWNARTGQLRQALPNHVSSARVVEFSPDGLRLVAGFGDGTAQIWDTNSGQQITQAKPHDSDVVTASFSPQGDRVLTASRDKTAAVWSAQTGKTHDRLLGHQNTVRATFSPDGRSIVTSSFNDTVRIWDDQGFRVLRVITSPPEWTTHPTLSPDGRLLVAGFRDGSTRIWDLTEQDPLFQRLAQHAAYSSDGARIVTARVIELEVLDPKTGQVTLSRPTSSSLQRVTFDSRGTCAVATSGNVAVLLRLDEGPTAIPLQGHLGRIASATFSSDGKRVVTASDDWTARIWDSTTGQALKTLEGHTLAVSNAIMSPDGTRVVTTSHDKTVRVWDANTGEPKFALVHEEPVVAATFSPDGRWIATGSDDGARIWATADGALLQELTEDQARVSCVAFDRAGLRLATAGDDLTARIWDVSRGRLLHKIIEASPVRYVSFNHDGSELLTIARETARVWDAGVGKMLHAFPDGVREASFNPVAPHVMTLSMDGILSVWDEAIDASRHERGYLTERCRNMPPWIRRITQADIDVSPILTGRLDEDVCAGIPYDPTGPR